MSQFFTTGAQLQAAINELASAGKVGSFVPFNGLFYGQEYMSAGKYTGTLSPIEHFVQIGAAQGNKPSAAFDPLFYQAQYPDLAGIDDAADLLIHFLRFGLDEGRVPNASLAGFDGETYLAAYPDVAAYVDANLASFGGNANNGALAHFVKFGQAQGFTVPGQATDTFMLTASTDRGADFTGTSGADSFEAYLNQNNFAGGVSNTLSSADVLNGGAGADTLYAELVPEFFGATGDNQVDVQPRISGIEAIEFEARDAGANNFFNARVTVDAKYITGVNSIGSTFSDGDLVVENLTTLTDAGVARNTVAITVTMDHTDDFNSDGDASDLTVLFDEDYLLAGQTSQSQAFYFLLDEAAELANNPNRLDRIDVDGIRFSLDGGATVIELQDPTAQEAGTHAGFVAALQNELADLIAAGTVPVGTTLTLDSTITDDTGLDDGSISDPIPAIVLDIGDGTTVTPIGFSRVEELIGQYDVYGQFNAESQTTAERVTVNVELNKVGRDGEGGNLVIGGKDQNFVGDREVDQRDGIAVFNIAVVGNNDLPSNLGFITSTDQALSTINISSPDSTLDTFAALTIRDAFNGNTENLSNGRNVEMVNASSFLGDLSIGASTAALNVDTLTATGGGKIAFVGRLDGAEDGVFSYTTGAAADRVTITVDGNAIDTRGDELTITTNDGNDSVILSGNFVQNPALLNSYSQRTQSELQNVNVNAGAGDDTVDIDGNIRVDVEASSGSDFVIVDELLLAGVTTGAGGEWTFGQATGPQTFGDRVLYQSTIRVTFAGFESRVSIDTNAAGNFVANQETLNEAIERAINASPELKRLLSVDSDEGYQQITVSSLVGGLNDLRVEISQPQAVATNPIGGQVLINAGTLTQLVQGIIDTTALTSSDLETAAEVQAAMAGNNFVGAVFNGNVGINGAVGSTYQAFAAGGSNNNVVDVNYSVIDMGTGANDLVVLDSNLASANVIEITQAFGKVSVVNFHNVSPNDAAAVANVGNHALDFTSYLNNRVDPSATTNTQSATTIAVTLNTNAQLVGSAVNTGVALANSVNMLNFDGTVATSVTFANLTATNLVAALNGDIAAPVVGGIVDTSLDAANNTATLIGNVQKHIVMVENNGNRGEYKVFYLTSTVNATTSTTAGKFDVGTAQLLGTLDFGNSINFNLVGSTAWKSEIANLLAQADGIQTVDPVVPTYELSATASSVNEGSSVAFNLATTNVADGTVLTYVVSGTGITAPADVAALTGTVTVVGGAASLVVSPTADATTEGPEALAVTIMGSVASVTINDTSLTPVPGAFTTVELSAGTPAITATAAAEAFVYDFAIVEGRVTNAGDNDVTITGFDVLNDKLVFNNVGTGTVLTEAEFLVLAGVSVAPNPFEPVSTTVFVDPAAGVGGSVVLVGVLDTTDLAQITLETTA